MIAAITFHGLFNSFHFSSEKSPYIFTCNELQSCTLVQSLLSNRPKLDPYFTEF